MYTKQIALRTTEALHAALTQQAAKEGRSLNTMLNRALQEYVKKETQK